MLCESPTVGGVADGTGTLDRGPATEQGASVTEVQQSGRTGAVAGTPGRTGWRGGAGRTRWRKKLLPSRVPSIGDLGGRLMRREAASFFARALIRGARIR